MQWKAGKHCPGRGPERQIFPHVPWTVQGDKRKSDTRIKAENKSEGAVPARSALKPPCCRYRMRVIAVVSALLCAGLLAKGAELGTSDQDLASTIATLSGVLRHRRPVTLFRCAKVRLYAPLDTTLRDRGTTF